MSQKSPMRHLVSGMTLLGYVFLFAPLVILIIYSFNEGSSTIVWTGFSFHWYQAAFDDRGLRNAIKVSAIVAAASSLIATSIGGLTALAVIKRDFKGKTFFSTLLIAPLVLPEIVLAVGILIAAVFFEMRLGYITLIAGHVLVSVPFAFLIIRAAASGLDSRLDEAAADLGADAWQSFRRVTLPLLMPAIFSALLLCAVISFDDFVISTFVSGVGTTPLPIEIYSMLKTGLTPKINALGTMLIGVNIIAVMLVMGRYLTTVRKGM